MVRDVWQISNLDNSVNMWVLHRIKLMIWKLRALIDISASIMFPTFVEYIHLYSSQQWRHAKKSGFDFWSCVISTWPWRICRPNFVQIALSNSELDIFRNPRWRPPPSWIFKSCKFGTFRHVNSVVLEHCIKFCSNICSHGDRHTMLQTFTGWRHTN